MSFTGIRMWIRALLFRRRIESEMDKEMRLHLDLETDANIRAGMAPRVARRNALIAFRGVDRAKEDYRDALGTRVLDESWRDLRYAARLARRSPAFTITAVTLLALAVGTASAIFSVAYTVLLRPLPYPDPDRLVFLTEGGGGVAWPNYLDWRDRATVFSGLAGSVGDAVVVTGGQAPLRLESRGVTSNFFRVLGVSAFKGRVFDDADALPDAAPTAVVSHELWMRELGGRPEAIGKTLSLSRGPYTVIGVLPPGFRYMTPADVYVLLEPLVARNNYRGMQNRNNHTSFFVVGRLKSGVSIEAAQAEMHTIAVALMQEYPIVNKGADVPVVLLAERIIGSTAPTLTVLAGAVTLLLLIACINLASLLLNRTASRAHEFSVRAAIGGSRQRLVRQLVIEQALFCVVGGVLGALAGGVMLRALVKVAPRDLPRLDEIHLDLRVLAWTTLAGAVCALAFGIGPALKASGITRGALVLRAGQRSTATSAMRRALMIAEIAVATVLLFGAGLMVHTMVRLARVDPGFDPHHLQTFAFSFAGAGWSGPEGDARKQAFFDVAIQRLRAVSGVENAALAYSLPIAGSNWWSQFRILGRPADPPGEFGPNAGMVPVSAGYFETLRIPLIKGRYFDRSDKPNSLPVAIINNSVARKFWPDEDPIGKQVRGGSPGNEYGPVRTIVGVVGDIKYHGVDQDAPQQMFMPILQEPRSPVFAIARTRGALSSLALEAVIHNLDASVPVFNDRTLDQVMREASSQRRFAMILLSVFGGVAVLLAAIGLYGVIAQSVSERRNEIGIRMSLGATQTQVVRMFLQRGMVAAGVGLACGLIAAAAAARSLQSMVFGLTTTDPLTIGAVVALLASVALAACYVPARSAARVDPARALRVD